MKSQVKLLAALACSLVLFSCAKDDTGKKSDKLQAFAQFSANLAIAPTDNCSGDCVDRKKEFQYLAYVAEKIYCYWDEKQAQYQIDFKAKAVEFQDTITNDMSETQYFMLLMKWAGLFKDGHVNPMLKSDTSQLEFYSPNVRLEMISPGTDHETLIVSQIGDDVTKLKVGTVVNKIQGKDWKDYLPAAEAFTMGSTDYMRKRQMANLIFRVLLEQEGPKPILIEGTYNNVPVQETVSRKLSLYDAAQAPAAASTGLELLKTAILENNIGYLRIDGFSGSKMPDLLTQAMTRLQGTNALLIDVRFNGGGDQSGNTILSFLADHNIIRYKHRSVYSDYLLAMRPEIAFDYDYVSGKFTELADRNVKSNGVTYRKPVAVLISPNCFSACDTFVSAIQQNKLATVLGEHTGGGTGSPQVFDLPVSGHSFRYSVDQGFTAVDGGYIEGHGTAPDVVIEPTVAERMEKKDRQLEKALNWLFTKTQETAPATPAPANPTTPSPVIGMQVPDSLLTLEPAKISAPIEVEMDKQVKAATE